MNYSLLQLKEILNIDTLTKLLVYKMN